MTIDDVVPITLFGRDHWSTLAYAETVMVECGGFQIGFDGRMRQCRHNFRVMREECNNPKRPRRCGIGIPMEPKYSTILADGSVVDGHDDWHCIQDMVENGLLSGECQPGETLHLTELGKSFVAQLRDHKRKGGTYKNFRTRVN
jgi:hypothetical protein